MPTPANNLGYGAAQSETTIDNANIGMRSMPWYQDYLKSIGQGTGNVHLSESQSQQILKLAQAHGFVVDEGNMEVDPSGNFRAQGHKLRNTLIVAGLAGAALLTAGLATPLLGAGGAASAGASGAAGVLGPSTAANMAATAGIVGGSSVPAGIAAGSGAAAAAGGGASLWSQIGKAAASKALGGGAGGGGSTWQQIAGMAGSAIGKAGTAAGNNDLNQEKLGLEANSQNITGNTQAEDALAKRAALESTQRKQALADVYRASAVRNPSTSQFNTHAPAVNSQAYMDSLTALEQQGLARLRADPTYATSNMAPLAGYKPLDIANLQGATNSTPSALQRFGQYVGPALSVFGPPPTAAALRRQQANAADDANFGG